MDLAQYYKKADPVLGVAKILFLRLFDLFENKAIAQIAKSTSGGTPNRGNPDYYGGNIPWLKSGELNDSFILESQEFITDEGLKNSSAKYFDKETLLVAMYGATAGKTGIIKIDASTNQAVCALFPSEKIERDFLFWFLKQHRIDFILQSKGGAQPNISQKVIKETLIPVPPLDIQKKVISFLNTINESGFISRDFEILNEATIKQINQFFQIRNTNEKLNQNFQTQKSLLTQLKQAILQEAIQGKLTCDWRVENPELISGENSATTLLEHIKVEKEQLVKEKRIKKEKLLPPIEKEEIPFELPEGWVWCRLLDLSTIKGGKRIPSGHKLLSTPTEHIYLRVSDMQNGTIIEKDLKYLRESTYEKIKKYTISQNDIYMTIVGGTIGKCGLIPEKFNNMLLTENAAKITPVLLNKLYLYKCFGTNFCQKQFLNKTKQVAVQKMSLQRFGKTLIPLPSLEEQKAIVKKVETLMEKCTALEQEITQSEQHAQMLMQAVLKEAFEREDMAVSEETHI